MVAISEIRSSNSSLHTSHQSLTAVFIGATSGIGKATLQSFAKHIPNPTAIILGRNEAAFAPELSNLNTLNPNGTYTFLESEISLISQIDSITSRIISSLNGKKIDLLYLSQGYISFSGREEISDGLDISFSLRYYGRIRFIQNLLPHLSPSARVISILAGGQEGKIFEEDLDLKRNYSIGNAAGQMASFTTLTFDHLAKENEGMGFVHVFPGLTQTGSLGRSAKGILAMFLRWIVEPVLGVLVAKKPEEVGERMLYYGTTEEFAKGSWALDWDGTPKEVDALKEYRRRGFAEKVAEHNERTFEQALSR
ncbi:NmrA-like family domain-containing oxidoreductase notO [Pseudocercospora fuligena]|uniref:NmrA-like family domain-containing oxidoreductase notO n=1 Tax=Pseudocercospora fuligena TaxID=685502 RepID=A0A8H6VDF4_9PEZI|nr:NmrA-like family domain-containing oxidoreductase notO [Pseudocercospora fuligena]